MRLSKFVISLLLLTFILGMGFTYADEANVNYLVDNVDKYMTVNVPQYGIFINDKPLGYLESKEEAQRILSRLKTMYLDEGTDVLNVHFKEDVSIIKDAVRIVDQDKIFTEEMLFEYIVRGTNERKIHVVKKGENLGWIAIENGIKLNDLLKANPGIVPERLQINQEVSLIVPKPLITVITTEQATYTNNIEFDVVYEDSSAYYEGDYRVKVGGVYGKLEIIADVYKENGIEVGRNIIQEEIIKQPSTKVVYRGTKDPPPRIGTGSFDYPYDTNRGYVTSPFGIRWGRRHNGVDIGMSTGTPVYAADGGKVVYSGRNGGYGIMVQIDHGANIETIYAHLSQTSVKVGEKVFKGQKIGLSGNTGVSTGPHLHFEVREIGVPKDPDNYLNFY